MSGTELSNARYMALTGLGKQFNEYLLYTIYMLGARKRKMKIIPDFKQLRM